MQNVALDIFTKSLPVKPYATDDLAAGVRIYSRNHALQLPYIQLHGVLRRFITLDIDRAGAAWAWEDAELPPPTIITVNPLNAHCHALYGLHEPVTFKTKFGTGNARSKPMRFYRAVREAYRLKLDADPGFAGCITKNPIDPKWHTLTPGPFYDLHELADFVDLTQIRHYRPADDYAAPQGAILRGFRNDSIFNYGRKWAYRQTRAATSAGDFFDAVLQHCQSLNVHCVPPLPGREVYAIARSISRYCWTHRDTIIKSYSPNRGIMGFAKIPPVMELNKRRDEIRRRRAIAALHTHETRRQKTEEKILAAIAQLEAQGLKITKAQVARMTGLSKKTVVMAYGHLFP